jgi:YidC/Oxa1 family membrane protein insertase
VSFFKEIGSFIMTPLYFLVSAIMLGYHQVFGTAFGPASGISWVLSIIGLTVTIRALMIPLFVKQIKSSRNMQLLQPRVKELQKKYGHDRERLAQETMSLYRETKTNPLASCLPLLIQMPFFFALFRLIDQAAKNGEGRGFLTDAQAQQLRNAEIFGVKISASFTSADGDVKVQVFAAILVVAMTVTTFLTQRQLMRKNMPADALSGPYAQQQKMLLYVLPLVFAVGGIAFPIGVLLYWTTSNLWTMCQQFYVIRNNPAPNTEAFRAKEKRDEEKRKRKGLPAVTAQGTAVEPVVEEPPRPTQRQQPKKQSRSQRKRSSGGSKPGEATRKPNQQPGQQPNQPPNAEGESA